jgi:hypothetical protein
MATYTTLRSLIVVVGLVVVIAWSDPRSIPPVPTVACRAISHAAIAFREHTIESVTGTDSASVADRTLWQIPNGLTAGDISFVSDASACSTAALVHARSVMAIR